MNKNNISKNINAEIMSKDRKLCYVLNCGVFHDFCGQTRATELRTAENPI